MKLWRKMGNKVTLDGMDKPLSGRQFKHNQAALSGFKSLGSNLLNALVKRIAK